MSYFTCLLVTGEISENLEETPNDHISYWCRIFLKNQLLSRYFLWQELKFVCGVSNHVVCSRLEIFPYSLSAYQLSSIIWTKNRAISETIILCKVYCAFYLLSLVNDDSVLLCISAILMRLTWKVSKILYKTYNSRWGRLWQ